jgi:hypothetical protein
MHGLRGMRNCLRHTMQCIGKSFGVAYPGIRMEKKAFFYSGHLSAM